MRVCDNGLSINVYGDVPGVRDYTIRDPDYLSELAGVQEELNAEGQRLLEEGLEDIRAGRVESFEVIRRELGL